MEIMSNWINQVSYDYDNKRQENLNQTRESLSVAVECTDNAIGKEMLKYNGNLKQIRTFIKT